MTDAKGQYLWMDRELAKLREQGWSFKYCRQGIVIRSPGGGTQIWYGEHVVTGMMLERQS